MILTGRKNRRGVTVVDFILILLIVFFGVSAFFNVLSYRKIGYRDKCYENQKAADELLWKIVYEQKKEIPQLNAAYILHQSDDSQQMVLIFLPGVGESFPEKVVVDLNERGFDRKSLCPLRKGDVDHPPVIDYWYGAGRWWCMHNKYHN